MRDRPASLLSLTITLAILLAAAVALSHNEADPDLWGHVQYGRDAIQYGLPATTTYSFTAEGFRWINHENLAELLLAVAADAGGPLGLLAIKAMLAVLVVGTVLRHALKQGVTLISAAILVMLVTINMTAYWTLRPQLLSYVYFVALLALLSWSFQDWPLVWRLQRLPENKSQQAPSVITPRLRGLWLIPLLMIAWTNSHGGFVAGLAVCVTYLAMRSLEALWFAGRRGWPAVRLFGLLAVAACLATLLNPYGIRLHQWLLQALTIPRPEITEWHPPEFLSWTSLPMWSLVIVSATGLAVHRKAWDATHLVLLSLLLWQTLSHQRHLPFLALACGFWLAPHVDALLARLSGHAAGGDDSPVAQRLVLAGGLLVVLLLAGRLYQQLGDMPVYRDQYPVSALQFVADQGLQGKMVVTYNWAQYVLAAFGARQPGDPGIQVAFDGRFRTSYPQTVVDMHFDLVLGEDGRIRHRSHRSGPPDAAEVLRYGQPDLVLINRRQQHSEHVMRAQTQQWALLYQDQVAQLWGLRDRFDNPAHPDYIAPEERRIGTQKQQGSVTWPAIPVARPDDSQIAWQMRSDSRSHTAEVAP